MNKLEFLKNHQLKATKQRLAVLEVLFDNSLPLTISQIREKLDFDMDLSTLYRTLDTFLEFNIISRTVPLEPSQTVYELKRHTHRHHLICIVCGSMQVISGCPIHEYEHQVETSTGFIIDRHQLEMYGTCPKCQGN